MNAWTGVVGSGADPEKVGFEGAYFKISGLIEEILRCVGHPTMQEETIIKNNC